jgi:hypothetical protein
MPAGGTEFPICLRTSAIDPYELKIVRIAEKTGAFSIGERARILIVVAPSATHHRQR